MSNYKLAEFSSWIPNKRKLKAVIVLVPGSNHDGRDEVNDKVWQAFATKHQCALVGCHFTDIDPSAIEGYCDASGGSGQALLDYLAVEGFEALPILLYGHSAGGQFNYEFACWKPERVAAFIVNKGGIYYTALAPAATRQTPAMFFVGDLDEAYRVHIVKGLFWMNRVAGAIWQITIEACEHQIWRSEGLSRLFFADVLETMK